MVQYLVRKGHTYWFRRRICHFGEIVFSLKTKNHAKALIRHAYMDYQIKKLIYKGSFEAMSVNEIRELINKYKTYMINEEYNDYEDMRDKELSVTINGSKYGGHTQEALSHAIERYQKIHATNDINEVKKETFKILARSNLESAYHDIKSEKEQNIFHWELLKAEMDLLYQAQEAQQALIKPVQKSTEQTTADLIAMYQGIALESHEQRPKKKSMTISELAQRYISENNTVKQWSDKNRRDIEYVLGHFASYYEDREITELEREDFSNFRDKVIMHLPQRFSKKLFSDKTTTQVIFIVKHSKLPTLSKVTMNKHLRRIHQVFEWAKNSGYIDNNLSKDLAFNDKTRSDKKKASKLPYSQEDLKLLFEKSPWFTDDINITLKYNPEYIFIPLICLYTGAKPTELAQLKTSNIKTINGVIGIDFNNEIGLKTQYNVRFTPFAQELLDTGIMNYVRFQEKRKSKSLFPSITIYPSSGSSFTNAFTEYNRKYITQEKDKTFYSLRHLVNQKFKNKRTATYIINNVTGHSSNGNKDEEVYGDRAMPPEVLLESINECLTYEYLNLSHIKKAIEKRFL